MKAKIVFSTFSWSFLMLSLSQQCIAGPIGDALGNGAFGLPWGADAHQIETAFPKGKWSKLGEDVRWYTVNDDRPIFGVPRSKKSKIAFGLSSDGRLASISVTFPPDSATYGQLVMRMGEQFGPVDSVEQGNPDNAYMPTTIAATIWPTDAGIDVRMTWSVVALRSDLSVSIANRAVKPASAATGLE